MIETPILVELSSFAADRRPGSLSYRRRKLLSVSVADDEIGRPGWREAACRHCERRSPI